MPTTTPNTAPVLGIAALVEELPTQPHAFDKIESLPTAREAAEALTDTVVGFAPKDQRVAIDQIRMDPNGRLCRLNHEGTRSIPLNPEGETVKVGGGTNYTATGLSQLCTFLGKDNDPLPRSFCANLFYQLPVVRAYMFNAAIKRAGRDSKKPVVFRFLSYKGTQMLRAVTSEVHTLNKGDTFAVMSKLINKPEFAANGWGQNVRASLRYTWDRVSLDFYFPRPGVINGPVPFVRITLSETKDCSWSAVSGVFLGSGRIALAAQSTQDLNKTTGRHVGAKVAENIVAAYDFAKGLTDRVLKAIEASKLKTVTYADVTDLARTCDFDREDLGAHEPATVYDVAQALMDAAAKTGEVRAHELQLAAARVMQTAVTPV
jgi:hypothetical protein